MGRLSSFLGRSEQSAGDTTLPQEDSKDDLLSAFEESLLPKDRHEQIYQIAYERPLSTNLVVKKVSNDQTEIIYLVETAAWKKEPDLVFHQGSKAGPVVGSAVLRKRNHTMTLKLGGDGTLGDHQLIEDLAKIDQDKKWRDSAYTLAIPTSSNSQPRIYHFTRTQSTKDGVNGILAKMAYYNWSITNVRRERVGLWLENPKGGISLTTGTLKVDVDTLDQRSDLDYILLGLGAITERTRRDIQLTTQVVVTT
ncbi:hypothetical protein NliqN6_3674 [Naganishia liquefaciens]|uniref:Uncharacterized protein n=1 Tax=Naganishia liquefaciens TaxID=104408 RepID=A0A8H3TU87_9TREE|nr:hypothetical protein NliqN6_3674 [Naganishia liquefaciens]